MILPDFIGSKSPAFIQEKPRQAALKDFSSLPITSEALLHDFPPQKVFKD